MSLLAQILYWTLFGSFSHSIFYPDDGRLSCWKLENKILLHQMVLLHRPQNFFERRNKYFSKLRKTRNTNNKINQSPSLQSNMLWQQATAQAHQYIYILYIYMMRPTWMFMDSIRKQIYQCAQYKLKIVYKTTAETLRKHFFYNKINFLCFHAVLLVKNFPIMYQLLATVGVILTKLRWFWRFSTSQNSISTFFKSYFWVFIL